MNANNENIHINTRFDEKDIVKALGARWDGGRKQWYVLPDANLKLFERWLPISQDAFALESQSATSKPYLNTEISKIQACDASLNPEQGFNFSRAP